MAGISLAPDDGALTASPTWERIDTDYNIRSWAVDRGRPNEMSQTGTGTATVELIDRDGDFDPTNTTGAFFGRLISTVPMGPLVQAKIELQNPNDSTWTTLFRGFISSIQWVPYIREDHANVTLELVDGLAYLAACEMVPDGSFGNSVNAEGNIVFDEDTATDAVKTRMAKLLDDAGWPGTLREIFTGNVSLWETIYAPRTPVLTVLQEAADAEFPFVANVYIGGPRYPGEVVFHGRYARFNPAGVQYDIETWEVGDDAAAAADAAMVRVSPPLVASVDDTVLYNSAFVTQKETADGDMEDQYVTDAGAVLVQGLRTWSAENLLTRGGDAGRTGNEETLLMAEYVADNFSTPAVRVGQLTVKSRPLTSLNGPATWNLLTQIDISDIVHLVTTHGGGGGFDDDFFVEGIHYTARPGGTIPYVELTLDVSPRAFYGVNPFDTGTDELLLEDGVDMLLLEDSSGLLLLEST